MDKFDLLENEALFSQMYSAKKSCSSSTGSSFGSFGSSGSNDEAVGTHSLVAAKSSDEKLLDLTNITNYNLVQRNGQRIYGGPPPGWMGVAPEKGCEIFVGKVPRDCYEDELVPIFAAIGKIYELRLMMDFSGSNRGYFFVRYTNRDDAKMAVRKLNNYEIRSGKFLGVIQSVDNRKLWISGIPKNRSAQDIKAEMDRLTEGVRDVILYQSQTDKSKTRGYAFVEYESHRAAALARRKLVPGRIFLLGQEIEKVDWAEPENEVDEDIMSKVRILFIRNLMASTTETKIRDVFEELSEEEVERVKKTKDYAFVHFTNRDAAERAMIRSHNLKIDGSLIEVSWSKPVDKNVYNQRKHLTKILTQGGPPGIGIGYESPLAQLNHHISPLPTFNGYRGICPRKRGAAGIRGLGAPGTLPPRRLVKMSMGGSSCGPITCNGNGIVGSHHQHGGGGGGFNNNSLSPQTPTEFSPYLPPHFPQNFFFNDRIMQPPHPGYLAAVSAAAAAAASGGGGSNHAMDQLTTAALDQQIAQAMFNMTINSRF